MTSRISIRSYRAGFLFVVALLIGVSVFTLWADLRTNERVDDLVTQAFVRDALIGRIRVAALTLESAVDAHIRATTDEERAGADDEMESTLDDISLATQDYTKDLPPGETEIWRKFRDTSHALAAQVRKAVNYSKGREAERARKHLVQEIKPITAMMDQLANQLSEKNAEETRQLLRHLEDLRFRTTIGGAIVATIAVLLSLLVGFQVTTLITKQADTIRAQVVELDRRNKELDSFASRVAHDLVSPLSPLKGYLTLIRRSNAIRDEQVVEMLTLAESSAGRMAELIEALLRFCRAGTRGEPALGELDTAVTTLLLEVDQVATKEHVKLERSVEKNAWVNCPAQLLQSIAQNLLSNAVKYTAGRPEPKVIVRVYKERAEAVLEVIDNGCGMSGEAQGSLFQPFFRTPEARGLPGHGLGLATTKRLVEAHGGTITVRSALHVGTHVTVRFPLVSAQDAATARGDVTAALVRAESQAQEPLLVPGVSS